MRVNELAESIQVTADTVRYYTRIGLLTPQKSIENGYKYYNLSDQKRLLFIIKARSLGMSVSEVQEIIKLANKGSSPCCRVREIVYKHIGETKTKIDELNHQLEHMQHAADIWTQRPDGMPDGDLVCELIEKWV
ncbi:MAG: MerR family Zn(II)-responsive transcriptional regulator of zntA [Oleiphilaceae bacterium]|jgi:DNA-binding transcriptional MerR regulator